MRADMFKWCLLFWLAQFTAALGVLTSMGG